MHEWVPQAIATLERGRDEVRIPLAVFFNPTVRGEIERQLEERDLHPQWDVARRSVDAAGAPVQVVPVIRVEPLRS